MANTFIGNFEQIENCFVISILFFFLMDEILFFGLSMEKYWNIILTHFNLKFYFDTPWKR